MSGLVEEVVSIGFVAQAVRIGVPYACAAAGGALTERAGVIDLALEAKLLWGAFAAATAAHATGSVAVAVIAAMAAGAAIAAVQLVLAQRVRADQVVVGVALNLASYGLTRYLLGALYGSTANSPQTVGVGSAVWTSPVAWTAAAAIAAAALALARTPLGLRVRAAGDRPAALTAAGISVTRVRLAALLAGGALAGLGGAQLSLAVYGFSADMSGARGYTALALVILAGWRPGRAALAALAFGAVEAFALRWQLALGAGADGLRTLAQLLPYVVTLAVLVWAPPGARSPRALGRADDA